MTEEERAQLTEAVEILRELRAELQTWRPLLDFLRPNGRRVNDLQRAGLLRAMRKKTHGGITADDH